MFYRIINNQYEVEDLISFIDYDDGYFEEKIIATNKNSIGVWSALLSHTPTEFPYSMKNDEYFLIAEFSLKGKGIVSATIDANSVWSIIWDIYKNKNLKADEIDVTDKVGFVEYNFFDFDYDVKQFFLLEREIADKIYSLIDFKSFNPAILKESNLSLKEKIELKRKIVFKNEKEIKKITFENLKPISLKEAKTLLKKLNKF